MTTKDPEKLLQRLDWTVVRRLDGILQGDYRTLFQGFGLDFAELREYQYGDDVRYMDWNVTARMNAPYVRQYMEDREINVWFLLDLSPSVDFGTTKMLKRNQLTDFTATIARLLTRHGNRVGAIFFSGKIDAVIPPQSGKIQVLRMVGDLLRQPALKRSPLTDLGLLFNAALLAIKRRSLIFVVSDFIAVPGWERALNMLARRHELLAVRLYDPREMELPDIGTVALEDAETGEQLIVDTGNASFRKRFIEAARQREADLDLALGRAGVDVLQLSTEDDLVRGIIRFAGVRKARKRMPASFAGMNSVGRLPLPSEKMAFAKVGEA